MAPQAPTAAEIQPQQRPDIQTLISSLTSSGKGSARVATTTTRK
jgi:hypothetical protein